MWRGLLVALILVAQPGYAQDTAFHKISLAYGISIDIPSHWVVLSQDTRKNLGAAGQALLDNAGIEGPDGRKITLLAVNATPYPTGAMIRVSVTSPSYVTKADLDDLSDATAKDHNEIRLEFIKIFKQLEHSGGPKIIEMQKIRIGELNNYKMMVISYTRAGMFGPSSWEVIQYKIPVSNRLIEITLSHRKTDAIVWKPILERVKRSVRF